MIFWSINLVSYLRQLHFTFRFFYGLYRFLSSSSDNVSAWNKQHSQRLFWVEEMSCDPPMAHFYVSVHRARSTKLCLTEKVNNHNCDTSQWGFKILWNPSSTKLVLVHLSGLTLLDWTLIINLRVYPVYNDTSMHGVN